MKRIRVSVLVMVALLVAPVSGEPVMASGFTTNPGASNTVLYGSFNDGGSTCSFAFQYGNYLATAYAKMMITSDGCETASWYQFSYNSSAGYSQTWNEMSDLFTWEQASSPVYYGLLKAGFQIENDAGYQYCFNYNALNNAKEYDAIVYFNPGCLP